MPLSGTNERPDPSGPTLTGLRDFWFTDKLPLNYPRS